MSNSPPLHISAALGPKTGPFHNSVCQLDHNILQLLWRRGNRYDSWLDSARCQLCPAKQDCQWYYGNVMQQHTETHMGILMHSCVFFKDLQTRRFALMKSILHRKELLRCTCMLTQTPIITYLSPTSTRLAPNAAPTVCKVKLCDYFIICYYRHMSYDNTKFIVTVKICLVCTEQC